LLYLPIVSSADFLARQVGRIQQGRISVYLTYSFVTLITLLFFAR
jgi:hydrogenase-4 component B